MTTEKSVEFFFSEFDKSDKKQEFLKDIHDSAIMHICDALCESKIKQPLDFQSQVSREKYKKLFCEIFSLRETNYFSLKKGHPDLKQEQIVEIKRSKQGFKSKINNDDQAQPSDVIDMILEIHQIFIPEDVILTSVEIKSMEFPFSIDNLKEFIDENSISLEISPEDMFGYLLHAVELIDTKYTVEKEIFGAPDDGNLYV